MKLTKYSKYIAAVTILISLLGFEKNLFSWGLFNLFSDTSYSKKGLNRAISFDPDEDILYLPKLNDKELFESINDLSICRKKEVRKYIYIYLTSGRKYTKKSIEKSYIYKDIIEKVFKDNPDIPAEIAVLPLLESGFNPLAVSRSRAVGLWQFMKNTATPLGLQRNKWIDERRDIEKSTEAAIRHLRNLHKRFGSWELALAAYNGGGGHVKRSMNKTGAKDFWTLSTTGTLSRETAEYVPRFIALTLIYKNQRLFDIKDEIEIPETIKTENFAMNYSVNIHHISKLADIPVKTIKRFNPELKRNITPPYRKNYSLRIPVSAADKLKKREKELYKFRYRHVRRHRVKNGECISIIARNYKKKAVTSSDLTA